MQGCSSPAPETHLQGCFRLRAQHKAGEAGAGAVIATLGGSCILHIALLRGFLPVGVKVSGEQSQRAEHMALVRHAARSCCLP